MNDSTKPSSSFWIISVLALIWNGFGALQYLTLKLLTSETVVEAAGDDAEPILNAMQELPSWVTAAFAIAVWGGLLASILLLMRKKLAKTIFLISLIGIIVQEIYTVFLSGALETQGISAIALPVVILLVGIYLYYFSGKAATKGWIK